MAITARELCDEVKQLIESGDMVAALARLQRNINAFPEEGRVWELCGIVLHRQREWEQATGALERASLLVPLSAPGQFALADCYCRAGHNQAAEAILVYLAGRDDLSDAMLSPLARRLSTIGRSHLALDVCREATRRDTCDDQAFFAVAYYLGRCGYPAELVANALRRALFLAPGNRRYRLALGTLLARCNELNEAYRVLASLAPCELRGLHCAVCVEALCLVYQWAGDDARLAACRQRHADLAIDTGPQSTYTQDQ